jgi:ADP-ribose pyrophosphatase YjhB (NUDIX family)
MDVVFKTEKAIFNYRVAGIWIEDGHILLHKAAQDTHWSLPGGRVEIAEESKVSLKREFKEELNIEIKVERLIWVVENFFEYDKRDIHEIGLYYAVSTDAKPEQLNVPFHGVEGDRLIFQWTPISAIADTALYPEYLRTALKQIPQETEHLVVTQ